MKQTLTLKKPIMINGNLTSEIPYDFDELTAQDILDVDKARVAEGRLQTFTPRLEGYTQFALFTAAVAKAEPHIAPEDLRRLGVKDAIAAQEAARNFLFVDEIEEVSEDGAETTSDEQSPILE